jgi:hypothetical protein
MLLWVLRKNEVVTVIHKKKRPYRFHTDTTAFDYSIIRPNRIAAMQSGFR